MKQSVEATNKYGTSTVIKFLIPSIIGVLLFLIPVYFGGKWTIGIAIVSDLIKAQVIGGMTLVVTVCITLSVVITIIAKLWKPAFLLEHKHMRAMFYEVSPVWLIIRVIGAVFAVSTYFKIGPEFIWSDVTGVVSFDIINVLAIVLTVSSFFIFFLLEFGLMELVGTLVSRVMRPLFKLPGRSALDCLASWMGSASVGVILTTTQYEEGYYSDREACVVSTCFSLVSVTFTLVHIRFLGMEHMFVPIYLTICLGGVLCAMICCRIYPLNRKKDTYHTPECTMLPERIPAGVGRAKWAAHCALEKADGAPPILTLAKRGGWAALDVWMTLLPTVMCLATIALILAEFTPFFSIISTPLVPLLNALGLPDAAMAAPSFFIGFTDQLIAAVIGGKVPSEFTRFVLSVVTLNQLIYMSETGAILMKSKVSINLSDLVILFIERTLITLPLALLAAKIFVG